MNLLAKPTTPNVSLKATRIVITSAALLLLVFAAACGKKKTMADVPPPVDRAPAPPTVSLKANPAGIQQGQSASLAWQTTGADTVTIDPIGTVGLSGSQAVSPKVSTTYQLTATGPGGTSSTNTRLTVIPVVVVTAPLPSVAANQSEEAIFTQSMQDVFFDYDKADIREDQQAALNLDIQFLRMHSNIRFIVEGYADERGSTEYNLALGASRATAVRDAMVRAGINVGRIQTTSYGKEKPFCADSTEECWQLNRRGHFSYQK